MPKRAKGGEVIFEAKLHTSRASTFVNPFARTYIGITGVGGLLRLKFYGEVLKQMRKRRIVHDAAKRATARVDARMMRKSGKIGFDSAGNLRICVTAMLLGNLDERGKPTRLHGDGRYAQRRRRGCNGGIESGNAVISGNAGGRRCGRARSGEGVRSCR